MKKLFTQMISPEHHMVESRLIELQEKLRVGMEEVEQGKVFDGESVFAEIEADIQKKEAQLKD